MKGRKTGGRKKGTLNKATIESRDLCAKIVNDPVYRRMLTKRANAGTLAPGMEQMLWDRTYGKVSDKLQLGGPSGRPMKVEFIQTVRSSSGGA